MRIKELLGHIAGQDDCQHRERRKQVNLQSLFWGLGGVGVGSHIPPNFPAMRPQKGWRKEQRKRAYKKLCYRQRRNGTCQ